MRKIKYFFICLLLVATACKKKNDVNGGPTLVAGTIVQNHTNIPIANAEVWITAQKRGSGWSGGLGGGASASRYQRADSNGRFSFIISPNPDSLYNIEVRADPNLYFEHPVGQDGSLFNVENQDTRNMKVRVNTKGWIKFNVINESPLDTLFGLDLPDCITLYFLNKDTIMFAQEIGGEQRDFMWEIKKGLYNKWEKYYDEIFVPSIDTVQYTIKY